MLPALLGPVLRRWALVAEEGPAAAGEANGVLAEPLLPPGDLRFTCLERPDEGATAGAVPGLACLW